MNLSRITARTVAIALGALLSVAAPATLAGAEYRTGPGDVIEINVFSMPDLERRVRIETDGTIAIPIAGTLSVAGLTVAELRRRIQSALSGQVVTFTATGGRERAAAIGVDDVIVSIASYRPIYVKGDVTQPGEYSYRGPMSIREAIALAGGYISLRNDTNVSVAFSALDASAEREAHWQTIARQRARIWRIKAELGKASPKPAAAKSAIPSELPLQPAIRDRIAAQAVTQLENRNARFERERTAIKNFIEQLDEEIAIVEQQVAVEEKSYEADSTDLESLRNLRSEGIVTSKRLSDARRATLFSSTRLLQAQARLSEAKRQRAERQLQLHKLEADRKSDLYDELEQAMAEEAAARIEARAATRKLRLARSVPPQRSFGPSSNGRDGTGPKLIVHRRMPDGIQRYVENEDFEVLPGDVIEVRLGDPGPMGIGVLRTGEHSRDDDSVADLGLTHLQREDAR
ncbi:polysaccharide export outer membrane protein [Dichotomicrobium thermohalophilum]|uniref:Polysaccharide export outer membrane protein n=2 Tax=Dichotomicrobium thermohalophilum TaxID=933063 RepID=A0A397Q380_9HYPH|nr:polysaccharide export outer membrane protein [Dichotomicrobium thermohalophilum]